jgi:hypothetical protein
MYINSLLEAIKKDRMESCVVYQKNSLVLDYYRNRKAKDKQYKVYSITKQKTKHS